MDTFGRIIDERTFELLQTGAIIAAGPCAALREDARVREAYLGRGARTPAAL